jgi:hypothetical protein
MGVHASGRCVISAVALVRLLMAKQRQTSPLSGFETPYFSFYMAQDGH